MPGADAKHKLSLNPAVRFVTGHGSCSPPKHRQIKASQVLDTSYCNPDLTRYHHHYICILFISISRLLLVVTTYNCFQTAAHEHVLYVEVLCQAS